MLDKKQLEQEIIAWRHDLHQHPEAAFEEVRTAKIVAAIREKFPRVPIMASGGKTPETIRATIEAGANAIVYTPPSSGELLRELMDRYREEL